MNKVFVCLIVLSFSISLKAQNGSINEAVIWYQFNESAKLSENTSASFGFQYRDFVSRDQDYHLFLSLGITRNLPNGFSLGAGLINLNINQPFGEEYLLVPEIRPYQQLSYGAKFEKMSFKWRFMAEERYFRNVQNGELVDGHTFNFRFRNLAQVVISVADRMDVAIATEVFFNAGGAANLNAFDQHRTTGLLSYKIEKMKLSTGYMHWGVLTGGDVFQNRHTWLITASHSLDFQ